MNKVVALAREEVLSQRKIILDFLRQLVSIRQTIPRRPVLRQLHPFRQVHQCGDLNAAEVYREGVALHLVPKTRVLLVEGPNGMESCLGTEELESIVESIGIFGLPALCEVSGQYLASLTSSIAFRNMSQKRGGGALLQGSGPTPCHEKLAMICPWVLCSLQ